VRLLLELIEPLVGAASRVSITVRGLAAGWRSGRTKDTR
jgi:hypothetical protein